MLKSIQPRSLLSLLSPLPLLPLLALVPLLAASCDGTDGAVTADLATVTCAPGTLRLTGTIDRASIDVTQPSNTGGFDQADDGEFGSINNAIDPDATLTDLNLKWPHGILTGDWGPATGTVKIPTSAFPDDVFCAGTDTAVEVLPDAQGGGLQFRLETLASGVGCSKPRAGMLHGCWRP